jgi:hypothetical protein
MPQNDANPRASPPPIVVPVELEHLIFRLYPEASTRYSILGGIHDHVERLKAQGRANAIPVFLQQELIAMRAEEKDRQKSKRRKLFTVVGKVALAALAILSHWH